jgi:hypothetical protein
VETAEHADIRFDHARTRLILRKSCGRRDKESHSCGENKFLHDIGPFEVNIDGFGHRSQTRSVRPAKFKKPSSTE